MSIVHQKRHPAVDVASTVQSYVNHQQLGRVFSLDQLLLRKGFTEIQKPAVLKALSRLVQDKKIVRLTNGSYYRPKVGRFGRLPLETSELIIAVIKTKNATVIPGGVAAINALGLDTQLPMVRSFLSSERIRSRYNVKNVRFEYKESLHYFSRHFLIKDDEQRYLALLFWSALNHMDKDGITLYKKELSIKFDTLLKPETKKSFFKALPVSMRWVRESFSTRMSEHEQVISVHT